MGRNKEKAQVGNRDSLGLETLEVKAFVGEPELDGETEDGILSLNHERR